MFPGGGQFYSEATGKGLTVTMLAAGAVGLGAALSHDARYRVELVGTTLFDARWDSTLVEPANRTPLTIGAFVGGAIWLIGALQAPDDARRANAQRARVSAIATPRRLGLAVAF